MSSEIAEADQHCGDGMPSKAPMVPAPPKPAIILGFLSADQAAFMIKKTEAATNVLIDPAYAGNLRVRVHPVHAPAGVRFVAIVPKGMAVQVGEQVPVLGWYASPTIACKYVPASVIARQ